MAVNTIANVYVLCEQVMSYSYKDQVKNCYRVVLLLETLKNNDLIAVLK